MSTDAELVGEPAVRAVGGPGVVAEVHLDHERLLLRPTLRRLGDATVVPEYRAHVDDDRELQFVSICADSFSDVETALAHDPTVANPVLVDQFVDRRVYRVDVTDEAIPVAGIVADLGGRVREATGTATAWVLQLRLPTRDALVSFNDECRRRDVSVSVTHLRTADDDEQPLLGLTDKQQELLTVAYEEGYFDVPRGISQDELADRLGVSKSAVSQRLRRAMTELCATTLRD
ncbi:helix-turn-helix domain-containing protein [Halovivax sp.]|uniref:helix-turn-helix domain-containing protein n=1 Tax=Halovivax sp. TaxID=1935978 RepID=UPI0025C66F19|nr:helix-turn-helix domain-containing protein [Halovivax sp.]